MGPYFAHRSPAIQDPRVGAHRPLRGQDPDRLAVEGGRPFSGYQGPTSPDIAIAKPTTTTLFACPRARTKLAMSLPGPTVTSAEAIHTSAVGSGCSPHPTPRHRAPPTSSKAIGTNSSIRRARGFPTRTVARPAAARLRRISDRQVSQVCSGHNKKPRRKDGVLLTPPELQLYQCRTRARHCRKS